MHIYLQTPQWTSSIKSHNTHVQIFLEVTYMYICLIVCRSCACFSALSLFVRQQEQETLHSSGDETVNLNFFTVTTSTTFTQFALEATSFGEIMQNKSHQAVQGHRFYDSYTHTTSHTTSYYCLILTSLLSCTISEITFDRSKIAIFGYPSCV